MHRLLKFSPGDTAECSTYNGMNTFALTKEDPWPERAITRANPVWSRRMKEEDEIHNKGKGLKEMEKRMYEPREGYNLEGEFLDSMDEFAHWESEFLNFLRTTSLPLRRHLPFLHEWYRYYAHRNIRAEKHYIACRNALLLQTKCSKEFFNQTESRVARFRAILSEAHRSLSSPNYDPLRMKKSDLAPFMRMNDSEFAAWREKDKEARNLIVAGLP
ncbi:hypothetical protein AGDE_11971 [Angomonas deanei]|nr:hypothetical protein AGDE_11971 [Angomonas deanei]|eukprot:EPY25198.1 hypothetical protein AGDE_11971 [Angomonas deanei]